MIQELDGLADLRKLFHTAHLVESSSGSEGGAIVLQFAGISNANHFMKSFYEFCVETRAMRHSFKEKNYKGLSKRIRDIFVLTEILESAFYRRQCADECIWVFTRGYDAKDFYTIWQKMAE